MKKTYRPPSQSQQTSGTNRQQAAGSRIQDAVTLNCDLKKSIWPNSLDVMFELKLRR